MKTGLLLILICTLLACGNQNEKLLRAKKSPGLRCFSKSQLQQDFDLLARSLKEAHTGLYWYSSEQQFDSVANLQRNKLSEGMNGLQFYAMLAPVVAFTKEDHCDIHISEEVQDYLNKKGLFLPLYVVNLKGKMWIVNDLWCRSTNLKGSIITAIDGKKVSTVRNTVFQTFAADGYILSSKTVFLDGNRFSRHYAKVWDLNSTHQLTVYHPQKHTTEIFSVESISWKALQQLSEATQQSGLRMPGEEPLSLQIRDKSKAVLTINTFNNSEFEDAGMTFKGVVDSCFQAIRRNHITHLVIDLRENGGGSEGNEDYLFAFLTSKPYRKYANVELSARTFGFLAHTDYAGTDDKQELLAELKSDYYQAANGKLYRKPGIYIPEPPKTHPFTGKVYILIGGWTYSGAAEFCSLMREHTNAVFIGQETGGGFFGNTSGTILELTLPNSHIKVDIPILKFRLDVHKGIFGRGVIPDYPVESTFTEYIHGLDPEMKNALNMIEEEL